jgi:hypothetical protein
MTKEWLGLEEIHLEKWAVLGSVKEWLSLLL